MFWAESAGDLVGLKLQGLAENVAASEAVLECVDEVSLKYKPRLQDPLARLGLEMITLCARLDAHNREKRKKWANYNQLLFCLQQNILKKSFPKRNEKTGN